MERKLIDYLPYVVREYGEFQAAMAGEQPEFERAWQSTDTLLEDQFVFTASKTGLSRWEQILGIVPRSAESLEDRRLRVLGRLNEELPYTLTRLREILRALCGEGTFSAEIPPGQYVLTVCLDHAVRNKLADVRAVLERVCPENLLLWLRTRLAVTFPNPQDRFLLRKLCFAYHIRSYGGTFIVLDGQRRLDGTWKLGQAASGARMIRIDYRVRLLEKGALWPGTWGCVTAVQTAQRAALPSLGIRPASPWQTGEALSVPKLQVQSAWRERQAFGAGVSWNGGRSRNQQRLEQPSTRVAGTFQTPEALSAPRIHIETTFQTKEHFSGTLTRDQTWSFDGTYRWDGTKQFNAGITKEDL